MFTIKEFLRTEVKPALGCTEPGAVALAVARAKEELGGPVDAVSVTVSDSIYKNGVDVGIPGTEGLRGNSVAAALSAFCGRSAYGLEVLKDCAVEIGLDVARWEVDFASPEVKQAVEADLREAQQLGVNAVPTLIFNERWILPGAVPESTLRQIVENLLEGKNPAAS